MGAPETTTTGGAGDVLLCVSVGDDRRFSGVEGVPPGTRRVPPAAAAGDGPFKDEVEATGAAPPPPPAVGKEEESEETELSGELLLDDEVDAE